MGCYEPFFPAHPCADPQPPYFLTAYEIAVKRGFRGTEEEWLESLTCFGQAQVAGYTGTIEDWIKTLIDPVPDLQIGNVETLEGGSMATASITGNKKKPILNLGIPRGLGMADALPIIGGEMMGPINMANFALMGLPTPTEGSHAVPKNYADQMLPKTGGIMTGELNMNGKPLTGIPTPTADGHAVPKNYADQMLPKTGGIMTGELNMNGKALTGIPMPTTEGQAANKEYVDSKHFTKTAALTVSGWSGTVSYKQTVSVSGILESDNPHICPVYSDTLATALAQKEAWNMVCEAETSDGSITFACFEDKPAAEIPIRIEVNR